ncbi:S8 family serine peptidase [Oceanicella sp. SM1341]|uniref:S8 family serine peptidase n=1 Tax=Oceanicella sp. SM1341 TaxID=1548889 RepID=UPI0013007386|nr:S8 family serine peptidase [Oceanicella sp. SM1341]
MSGRARAWSALCLLAPLLLPACAPAPEAALPGRAAAPPWRLADAEGIASDGYLILTVAPDTPEALAALAAAITQRYGVDLAAEWPLQAISVHCLVLDARRHPDPDALLALLRADPRIRTVQRMQSFSVMALAPGPPHDDPLFAAQTALARLNAPRAQQLSRGAGVRVGVIDSAIDPGHPDLGERLVESRDFVSRVPSAAAEAHGTAIAGIIGATAGNATGIVGVAPEAELVGLRACWQEPGGSGQEGGRCSSFSLARALNFAVLGDIPVLNLSLGGPPDALLEELLRAALSRGTVVVASWGESARPAFPAALPGVIAAGGAAGLPAPQVDVLSTAPGGGYGYVSGSSVAAAHVSGVAALLLAARPSLGPEALARALQAAVRPRPEPVLDACRAVGEVVPPAQAVDCGG